jgi:hypothetical protein
MFQVTASGNADPLPFNNFATVEVVHSMIDRPNDLRLTLVRSPGGILSPGGAHALELTFANVGTGSHDAVSAVSNNYEIVSGPGFAFTGYDLFPTAATPPCDYIRDAEGPSVFLVAVLFNAPVAPGTSQRCTISIVGLTGANGASVLRFELSPTGVGVYDINPADNVVTLSIPFDVAGLNASAVPISYWVAVMLCVLVVVGGLLAMRRITTTAPR